MNTGVLQPISPCGPLDAKICSNYTQRFPFGTSEEGNQRETSNAGPSGKPSLR